MKKLLVVLLLSLFLVSFISAQIEGLEERAEDLEEDLEDVEKILDDFEQDRGEYLHREWTVILGRSETGRFILGISNLFKALNPLFELLIGVEYSLSWLFFLSLGTWIAVVFMIFRTIQEGLQFNLGISLLISMIVVAISAQFDVFEMFVGFFTPLITNPWIISVGIIVGIIIVYIYSRFMGELGELIEEMDKKNKSVRREHKSKILEKIHDIELKGRGVKK
tara:strand:+ start:857 stop:1522 length:666 start_codon:yes stop_codon:yes gene_type:complete